MTLSPQCNYMYDACDPDTQPERVNSPEIIIKVTGNDPVAPHDFNNANMTSHRYRPRCPDTGKSVCRRRKNRLRNPRRGGEHHAIVKQHLSRSQ